MIRRSSILPRLGLLAVLCLSAPLQGAAVHVPQDFATIQGAIDGVVPGDSVIVRPGVYVETIDFLGKDIAVMSEQGAAFTIIDADFSGSVVTFDNGEGPNAVLRGFTLVNGTGTNSFFSKRGGAIFCSLSSPTITGNTLAGNSADRGGGIWCFYASPLITGNIIIDNSVTNGGGGISGDNSSPRIAGNTITGNDAYDGGAIHFFDSTPYVTGNVIGLNTATDRGGGVYLRLGTGATLSNNLIVGNTAALYGGGVFVHDNAQPTIVNNTIVANSAPNGGGFCSSGIDSHTIFDNTILWQNSAPTGPQILVGSQAIVDIDYSDIEGGQDSVAVSGTLNWGTGNLENDPLFLDGLYHLQPQSPCVDAGDTLRSDACLPPGLQWPFSDIGAYGGVDNCEASDHELHLILYPDSPLTVSRGGSLSFVSIILNNTANLVGGDLWLSAQLPNSTEMLIPAEYLQFANPFTGQVIALNFGVMPNLLAVPAPAPLGSYRLIGRIGLYPGSIIDETRFPFEVVP